MSYDNNFRVEVRYNEDVSIPLEQGNVLRQDRNAENQNCFVSIPLEQGNVLRLLAVIETLPRKESQSLWNRAMSYDKLKQMQCTLLRRLNPFGTGQCLTTKLF